MSFPEMKSNKVEYYKSLAKSANESLIKLKNRSRIVSYLRVFIFVTVGILFYFWLTQKDDILIVLSGVLVVGFLLTIKYHAGLILNIKEFQTLKTINEEEIQHIQGSFPYDDSSEKHLHSQHSYASDLDIFTKGELFDCINRTSCESAEAKLAALLSSTSMDRKEILERQSYVQELAEKNSMRQFFRVAGIIEKLPENYFERMDKWVADDLPSPGAWFNVLRIIVPVVGVFLTVAMFLGYISLIQLFVWLLVPMVITAVSLKNKHSVFQSTGMLVPLIRKLKKQIDIISHEQFSSNKGNDINRRFEENEAVGKINECMDVLNKYDKRNNPIMGFILNSYFLWDLTCYHSLIKWKRINGNKLKEWINNCDEAEAFFSLANFAFNNHQFIYPQVMEDGYGIQCKEVGHPLIPDNIRINNNFELSSQGRIGIITGANMAGKSTFLRTIGVNLILAFSGAPVCATEFKTGVYKVFTSMRAEDSLQAKESYFYAELRRLKSLVEQLANGEKLFIILDEILKGTNSKDKEQGSIKFLQKLLGYNATALVATHDLALCELQQLHPDKVVNLHFDAVVEQNDLSFDYKLKSGICNNMNASFLMEKMGIT